MRNIAKKTIYVVEGKWDGRYEEMDDFDTLKDAKRRLRRYFSEFPTVPKRIVVKEVRA